MTTKKPLWLGLVAAGCVMLLAGALPRMPDGPLPMSAAESDIAGVVTGPKGPEAGVWVIAETSDLSTNFVKIVVTEDQGRYVIPELPRASYHLWVRGYGPTATRSAGPVKQARSVLVERPTASSCS
jgi:hypothetical protein